MAGTNVVATKKALIAKLAAVPSLVGVQVDYAYNGRSVGAAREYLFGGSARSEHSLASFKTATTRMTRDEQVTLQVHIMVRDITRDAVAADGCAQAIGAVLEELLASDPTREVLPAVYFAVMTGISLG